MNALLVITPQPAYLEEAKKWIARLDSGTGGDGPRFYVFQLQNQRAEKLGAAAAAGVHRQGGAGLGAERAHARAGHAGGLDRVAAGVPAADDAAGAAARGRRHRERDVDARRR